MNPTSYFDTAKNEGYLNGVLYRDHNEWRKAGGSSAGGGSGQPAVPDLQSIYNSVTQSKEYKDQVAKIAQTNQQLIDREAAYKTEVAQQTGRINENPFVSEASRTGRVARLEKLLGETYNADVTKLQRSLQIEQESIAKMDADARIKVELATGQYSLNSQAYQNNLSQFNMLLSSGALSGASGSDIANLAGSTGIPTSMIQSAIETFKRSQEKISISQYDDGKNLYAIALDEKGNVTNKQLIGPVPIKSGSGSNKTAEDQQTYANVAADVKAGALLKNLIGHYSQPGGLTTEQIYQIYNTAGSPYGPAKETLDEVKSSVFYGTPGFVGR